MSSFELSPAAWKDLEAIASYTIERWGPEQADKYIGKLEDTFRLIAERPLIGIPSDGLARHLRRLTAEHHVVFYRPSRRGIRIVRVLHQRQLPRRLGLLDSL